MKAVPVRVPGTTIAKDTGNTASTNVAAQPGTGTANRIQSGGGGSINCEDTTTLP